MRLRSPAILAVIIVLSAYVCISHAAVKRGEAAPQFELPLVNGGGYSASSVLFPVSQHTFLVFWESNCDHCIDGLLECEAFHRDYAGDDIAIVGVNQDEADLLHVRGLLEANLVSFTQLWDKGGRVAGEYGVPLATFAIYLVDNHGVVVDGVIDPHGGMDEIMTGMLLGGEDYSHARQTLDEGRAAGWENAVSAVTGSASSISGEGFMLSGYQRTRFLAIDSYGSGAAGPYGEQLEGKNDMLYRFELEVSKRIGKYVTAGGLLRVSNESEDVLKAGPRYYGSQWGSAFAEAIIGDLSFRLGYYSIYMTPLTLMRWDWDDNPRTGGDAGCGCGAAGGVLLLESLEELNPELYFEGGIASYSGRGFETSIFYGIPRRADPIDYQDWYYSGYTEIDPSEYYSLEVYGFEWRWQRLVKRTGGFLKAGLHYTGTRNDPKTVDFKKLGYAVQYPWNIFHTLSLTLELPVIRSVRLRGEWLAVNRSEEHRPQGLPDAGTVKLDGGGGIAGVVYERAKRLEIKCDYLRLDPDFSTPFSALSYEANTEGARISSRLLLPGDISAVSVFYKRLREVEARYAEAEKERISMFGASYDLDLSNGVGCGIGWIDRGVWRDGTVEREDQSRRTMTLSARYRFTNNTLAQAQYQRVMTEGGGGVSEESHADLYSLYFTTVF